MHYWLRVDMLRSCPNIEAASDHPWACLILGCCVQDPRIQRLPCTHTGTYADDCLCERVQQHKCYIVATCDRDLRRRIRKASHGMQLFIAVSSGSDVPCLP